MGWVICKCGTPCQVINFGYGYIAICKKCDEIIYASDIISNEKVQVYLNNL